MILRRIHRQLPREDWDADGKIGVVTPGGKFIPDLTVAELDGCERDAEESWQRSAGIAMVVEVTSPNAPTDREPKRRGYAQAKIPLHLRIDRERKETALFSKPRKDDYTVTTRYPFGEPIPLPAPFSITLEDVR